MSSKRKTSDEKALGVFACIHKKHKGQVYVTDLRVIFITVEGKRVSFERATITGTSTLYSVTIPIFASAAPLQFRV